MNPSNRSPCPQGISLHLQEAAARPPAAARLPAPPKSVVTLERVQARGVTAGQKVEGVNLHEDVPLIVKPRLTEETRDGVTVTIVRADVAICDIINRNGRYYPRSCYEAANAVAAPELADGGLWALMDHPEWWEPLRGSLGKIATKWTGLSIEEGREIEWPVGSGNTRTVAMVVAEGEIVDTAVGRDIKGLMKAGIRVGISTNGYGSAVWKRAGDLDPNYYDPEELIPVVQDDFRYLSIDYVSDPSNIGGRARTEAAEHDGPDEPDTPTSPKEGSMHPTLKALCEKHGKTLEQIKKEHAPEYLVALEQIAGQAAAAGETPAQPATPGNASPDSLPEQPAPAPVPATPPTQENTGVNRTLETAVLQQRGQIRALEQRLQDERRDRMVEAALAAAQLPRVGTLGEGETQVDLDANFRNDLLAGARAAADDTAAQAWIAAKIQERRHLTQHLVAPPAPGPFDYLNRESRGGVRVPAGQTSAQRPEAQPIEGLIDLASDFGLL